MYQNHVPADPPAPAPSPLLADDASRQIANMAQPGPGQLA
jgi:hypothetical protein